MANIFLRISSHITCKMNLSPKDSSGKQTITEALHVPVRYFQVADIKHTVGHSSDHKCRLE